MTSLIGTGNAADNNRYEVEFLEDYNSILPSFDGIEALADAHVKVWDDIIRIPTIEEQVGLICGAGLPASAVVYALGDVYGDYIPQHVHDKARQEMGSPVSVPVIANPMTRTTNTNPMTRTRPVTPVAPPVEEPEEAEAVAPVAPFDPQPTHAETGRSKATTDALANARKRARTAAQQS